MSYEQQIDKSLEAINLLTHESRNKISIFSALRHTFNVGSYNKQKQLASVVNNREADQITTDGDIIITHQEEEIEQLCSVATKEHQCRETLNIVKTI